MPKARNYKKEYRDFHGKPEQIAKRSTRNKANRAAKKNGATVSKASGQEVHHKRALSKGGTNAKSNLKVGSARANRAEGGRISRRGKAKKR